MDSKLMQFIFKKSLKNNRNKLVIMIIKNSNKLIMILKILENGYIIIKINKLKWIKLNTLKMNILILLLNIQM